MRSKVIGKAAHQADDAVLGRGVVRYAEQATQPRYGAHQGDRSGPARDEVRCGDLAGAPHSGQIDIQHRLPGRRRELGGHPPGRDTRCGADDIEPAECFYPTVGGPLQLVGVTDVDDLGDDVLPGRHHELRGLVEVLGRRRRHHHGVDRSADV